MMKRLIAALLAALGLLTLPLTALGADTEAVEVTLPYYHVWTTDDPEADDRFTYRWTAVTEGAPLPGGGSHWDWALRGNTKGTLTLRLPLPGAGSYVYRLAAHVPKPVKGYSYEPRTFLLTVTVGERGRAVWTLLNEGSGEKVDRIDLDPSYTGAPAPKPPEPEPTKPKKKKKKQSKTASKSQKSTGKPAKTGDETRLTSLLLILGVSVFLLGYLVWEELRERRSGRS